MGDVTVTGHSVRPRSIWRTPRALLVLVLVAAAVVVAAVNLTVLINRRAEAARLQRDGVAIRGTVVWWEPIGGRRREEREDRSVVRVAYEYQERSYESSLLCNDRRCTPPRVLELWIDPRRPDRFATEHGDINDGVNEGNWIALTVMLGGFALFAAIAFLYSAARDPARSARRLPARAPAHPAPGDEAVERPPRRRLRTGARRWRRRS